MKSIILFRHGKSDWDADYDMDYNRPLKKRGIKAAKKMGQLLNKKKETPDIIISSTALRAKNTAAIAKKTGKWISSIKYEKTIYGGSLNTIISIIRRQNNKYNIICIVGHEPIFSSFLFKLNYLNFTKFPTAAMARIDFKTIKWNKIKLNKNMSRVKWFIKPKDID